MKSYRGTILQEILPLVERPSRYLGREWNSIQKDPARARIKVALAFPDTYEVGMSHLGLKILYHLLNQREGVVAERVYAPWLDCDELLQRKGLTLCTLESSLPLRDFDILGFTLQYELSYTNILNMLHLAGIPLLSEEREEGHPLIIAGGPSAFNPEPLADFIDLFVIGDGEEAIQDLTDLWLDWKKSGGRREELLAACAKLPGCYVPRFYTGDRPIEKRVVNRLDGLDPASFLVPYMGIIHDRFNLEVMRGCTRGCRFCQAGIIYRPLRERSASEILEGVLRAVRRTGYEEASLSSLSLSDLSCLPELLPSLMAFLSPEMVSLSLPSLRPEGLREETIWQVQRVRKTGFTIAPEAGTERLRGVINKPMEEKDFFAAIEAAAKAGWESVKLYFMVGLPTEGEEDLAGLARLAREGARLGRKWSRRSFSLTVSVSPFVPKPHTPFQWVGQESREALAEKLGYLRRRLQEGRISFKWHRVEQSFLEAAFSRGDRALGKVLLEAWRRGCRFDGWTDQLQFPSWEEAFAACGVEPSFYANRSLAYEEHLPWDHISTGVSKAFLYREYQRALKGQFTPDCHWDACQACGLPCAPDWKKWAEKTGVRGQGSGVSGEDLSEVRILDSKPQLLTKDQRPRTTDHTPAQRIRVKFQKTGELRFLSHLELQRSFSRALRRAGIPMAYSKGFNPQPRLSFASALPVGVEGKGELLDLELHRRMELAELLGWVNKELPSELHWVEAWEVPLRDPSLASQLRRATYLMRFDLNGLPESQLSTLFSPSSCSHFLGQEAIWVKGFRKGEKILIDAKPYLLGLEPLPADNTEARFELHLHHSSGGGVKAYDLMRAYLERNLPDLTEEEPRIRLRISRLSLRLEDGADP